MTFQECILIKRFLKPLIWGLFYLYIYTGGQKYRAGHRWICSAYSPSEFGHIQRIRQQLLLQVVPWDWKEKSAFHSSSKAVNTHHLQNKGHLKRKASILYNQEKKWHRTFPTLRRQQTHSCKRETPAGRANRKCLRKGTVYTPAPLWCAVSVLCRVINHGL